MTQRFLGICIIILLNLAYRLSYGQVIRFTDSYFKEGIPFVMIDRNDGSEILMSDLKGYINTKDTNNIASWSFYHPEYYAQAHRISKSAATDTLNITLQSINQSTRVYYSDEKTQLIIDKVLANQFANDPMQHTPFYYESYNKYHLSTTDLIGLKKGFNDLLTKLKLKSIKKFEKDHHLVLSETYTKRRYLDEINHDETIEAIQVSGIENPTLSTVNSQFQSFSIYDPFIKIIAKEYTNPLTKNTFRRYHFETVRIYPRANDTLYIVKANPKTSTLLETINAYYYINTSDYAIEAAILYPSSEKKARMRVYQHYQKEENGAWFPLGFSTIIKVSQLNNKMGFVSVTENRFFNLKTDTLFIKQEFSELAVKRGDEIALSKEIIDKQRKIELTDIDKNTFEFYDSLGNFKYFKNVADIAEKIYFKHIPLKKVDLVFDNTFAINDHENFRAGIGAQTNKKLSKTASAGVYTAYGFGDDQGKYGANLSFHPENRWEWKMGVAASYDLDESGRNTFLNDKYQHNTEWQRKLKVGTFDLVTDYRFFMQAHPAKYFDVYAGIHHSSANPQYTYAYNGRSGQFDYREIALQARYAYGLRYFQLSEEKIPVHSPYPILWVNYTRGYTAADGRGLNYHILESKLQYDINILGFGKSIFQFNTGIATGELPYLKLFNAHGSVGFRSVIHNSFETMGYNEFVSNRYLFAFYSHQFGTLHIFDRFKPKAEIAFNTGIGGLSNRERHEGIEVRSLERGFFESGFLLTNLLRINTSVVKINLGAGYYYRFGPNSFDTFRDNSVLKFVTQIGL